MFKFDPGQIMMQDRVKLASIEAKLDALMNHFNVEMDNETYKNNLASQDVWGLIKERKDIDAIKQYRKESGANLKEAELFINYLKSL